MTRGLLGRGGFELNRAPEVLADFELNNNVFLVDSTIQSLQSTVSGSWHTAADLVDVGLALDQLGVRELIINPSWKDGREAFEGLAAARPSAKIVGTFRGRHPRSWEWMEEGVAAGADEIYIESAPVFPYLEKAAERLRGVGKTVSHAFAEKHSWDELVDLSRGAARLGYQSLSFHDSFFRMGVTP